MLPTSWHGPTRATWALIGTGLIAACANPVAPLARGRIVVPVLRDTALSTSTPRYEPGSGLIVRIVRLGDTTPLATVTANALGEALFGDLRAGTYVVDIAAGGPATVQGRATDTVSIGGTDSVIADTLRLRPAAWITGAMTSAVMTQDSLVIISFAGVTLELARQAAPGLDFYVPVDTVVTDGDGRFATPLAAGPARYRFTFDASSIAELNNDTLVYRGSGVAGDARSTLTFTSSGGLRPDSLERRDITFILPSQVVGIVYRDMDGDVARSAGDSLVDGDSIRVQLRDSTGTRVLGSYAHGTAAAPAFAFRSLAPGRYLLAIDVPGSAFAATSPPVAITPLAAKSQPVTVASSADVKAAEFAIPISAP